MKRLLLIFAVLFIFAAKSEARDYYQNQGFNYFYSHLEPYGEWIQLDIDFYVWRPHMVGVNWRPYTNGRWHWTTQGWYWESFEPFGWATFHYGRWYYDDYYGWVWIPGNEWAPAWVEWRYNDAYVGWAPLPPYADFSISVGIHFNINWRSSPRYWSFVRYNNFCGVTIVNYVVPPYYVERIYNQTRYRNNYRYRDGRIYNEGINRNYVERRIGRRLHSRDIVHSTKLRDHNSRNTDRRRLEVYAPSKDRIENAERKRDVKVRRGDRESSLKMDKIIRRDPGSRDERKDVRRSDEDRRREIKKRPGRKDEIRNRIPDKRTRSKEVERIFAPKDRSGDRKIEKRDNSKRNEIERRFNRRNEPDRKIERKIEKRSREKVNRSYENKRSTPKFKEENRRKPKVKSRENRKSEPRSRSKSKSSKSKSRSRK